MYIKRRYVRAYVGYAERNSASEHAMQRLQNPAVTSPRICVLAKTRRASIFEISPPQITLVLPPDVRLIDKLAESAVHD
jgi:hypothetical protein